MAGLWAYGFIFYLLSLFAGIHSYQTQASLEPYSNRVNVLVGHMVTLCNSVLNNSRPYIQSFIFNSWTGGCYYVNKSTEFPELLLEVQEAINSCGRSCPPGTNHQVSMPKVSCRGILDYPNTMAINFNCMIEQVSSTDRTSTAGLTSETTSASYSRTPQSTSSLGTQASQVVSTPAGEKTPEGSELVPSGGTTTSESPTANGSFILIGYSTGTSTADKLFFDLHKIAGQCKSLSDVIVLSLRYSDWPEKCEWPGMSAIHLQSLIRDSTKPELHLPKPACARFNSIVKVEYNCLLQSNTQPMRNESSPSGHGENKSEVMDIPVLLAVLIPIATALVISLIVFLVLKRRCKKGKSLLIGPSDSQEIYSVSDHPADYQYQDPCMWQPSCYNDAFSDCSEYQDPNGMNIRSHEFDRKVFNGGVGNLNTNRCLEKEYENVYEMPESPDMHSDGVDNAQSFTDNTDNVVYPAYAHVAQGTDPHCYAVIRKSYHPPENVYCVLEGPVEFYDSPVYDFTKTSRLPQ